MVVLARWLKSGKPSLFSENSEFKAPLYNNGMRKLSDRSLLILQHIADVTSCGRKWIPGHARGMDDHDDVAGVYLNIGGAGDASAIKSLLRHSLIDQQPPRSCSYGDYDWMVATIAGKELLESASDRVAALRGELKRKQEEKTRRDIALMEQRWSQQQDG